MIAIVGPVGAGKTTYAKKLRDEGLEVMDTWNYKEIYEKATRVILMKKREILMDGTPEEVLNSEAFEKAFLT